MRIKGYTAMIMAAAMVAASPVAVFAQDTDTQMTSESIMVEDMSDQSLSEQPELPVEPAATQAASIKMVSFADSEAIDQDGIISRSVSDDDNGLYVITYGDEAHPVLDADKNEITNEYVDALVKDLKLAETEAQNDKNAQKEQETLAEQELAETVIETFEIDYVVNGEETPLDAPRYVILKIDGLLATDPVTILHQGVVDGKAEWAPLEILAQADGLVCARFDSFSPTVVLSTKEVALTASAASADNNASNTNGVAASDANAGNNNAATNGNTTNNGNTQNTVQNNAGNVQNNTQNSAGTDNANTQHVHNLTFVPAVAATSIQDGNIAYYKCNECGKMFTDENATNEVTDVVDHFWGQWIVTKSPTSTEAGIQERTCGICGEKETKEIPAGTDMTTYNPNADNTNTAAGNGLTPLNSANTTSTDGKLSPVQTGDQAAMPALCIVLAAAVAGLFGTNAFGKRHKEF